MGDIVLRMRTNNDDEVEIRLTAETEVNASDVWYAIELMNH